jgi:hypothetical protein
VEKKYSRPSRFNPTITLDQYREVLRYKKLKENGIVVYYRDLARQWGLHIGTVASIANRGMKQYDIILEKENDRRRHIPSGGMEKRNESRTLGVRPKSTETNRASTDQHSQGGAVRRGYSDFIRTEYFEE